jgi:hypothetical protein
MTEERSFQEERTWARGVRQALILAVLMFSSLGLYLVVLKWRGPDGKDRITWTDWDEVIPFQPAWVWVYLIPYLIGPVVIGLLSRETFRWYVTRALATVFITLAIFIVLPTQTAKRQPATGLDELTAQLYHNMVEIDEPPANAAPSLHVSLTCLLGLALLRDFPRWWPISISAVLLVWLATLFTRQHHLIDVGTGVALALVVALAPRFIVSLGPPHSARNDKPRSVGTG